MKKRNSIVAICLAGLMLSGCGSVGRSQSATSATSTSIYDGFGATADMATNGGYYEESAMADDYMYQEPQTAEYKEVKTIEEQGSIEYCDSEYDDDLER